MKPKMEFIRGENKMLYDGRVVTVLRQMSKHFVQVVNENSKLELVGRDSFRKPVEYNKTYGSV